METPHTFEWDEHKASLNQAKHGIPFDVAVYVFLDEERLDIEDTRYSYGEERRNVIGLIEGTLIGIVDGITITVTYTMREETARIISARPASKKERLLYGNRS